MENRTIIQDGDVDTAVIAEYEQSRRDLMRRGFAAGGAVVAATSIPFLLNATNAMAQASGDAAILEAAIGLEQSAVFAYTAAAGSGKLGKASAVATYFAKQEQEHADALIAAQKKLGGKVPAKPTKPTDVPGLAKAAGGSAADILRFAVALEESAVGAYYSAHGKLKSAELLSAGASIMANEGQHLVVLRQALKQNAVPDAFETGGKG